MMPGRLDLDSIPIRDWLGRREALEQVLARALEAMRSGALAGAEAEIVEAIRLLPQLRPLA